MCLDFYIAWYLQEREHNSEDEDEDKYADDIDMPGQNFDSKRRITVRNLRIREDIAKVSRSCELVHYSMNHDVSYPTFKALACEIITQALL